MLNKSGKAFLFSDRGAGNLRRPLNDVGEETRTGAAPINAPWEAHAALQSPTGPAPTRTSSARADDKLRQAVRKLHLHPGMLLFAVRAYPNLREVLLDDADISHNWAEACAGELPGGEVVQGVLSEGNPWQIIRFGGINTEFPTRLLRLRLTTL